MPSKSRLMHHFEQEWRAAGQDPRVVMKRVRQLLRSYQELAWRAALEEKRANDAAELAGGRALIASLLELAPLSTSPCQSYAAAAALMRRTLAAVAHYPHH